MSQLIKQSHASTGVPLWTPAGSGPPPFVAEYPDIWAGSPPTTTDDAVNRLSMLLYGRTVLSGPLSELSPMAKVIVNADNQSGADDAFVVKYRATGEVDWFARLGSSNPATDSATTVAVDSAGSVYVGGSYSSSPLTIFNADGTTFGTLINSGSVDVFVVKYNSSGIVQWARRMGGTGQDECSAIAVDSSGNVLVSGFYASNPMTIFNADGTAFGTLALVGVNDAFVVKYNTSGTPQWATRLTGSAGENARAISTDGAGNVYISGDYGSATTLFNSDGSTFGTIPAGIAQNDNFIVKYNTNGFVQWFARMSGPDGNDNAFTIRAVPNGDVYIGGRFNASPTQYPTPFTIFNADGSVARTVVGLGSTDGYIMKFSSVGVFQWFSLIGGGPSSAVPFGHDTLQAISTDDAGNIYGCGFYRSTSCQIQNADGTVFATLPLIAGHDVLVVKYNPAGVCQWATKMTGLGDEMGTAIAVDGAGNVNVGVRNTVNGLTIFNSDNTLFRTTANLGGVDGYVIRYNTNGMGVWVAGIGGTGTDELRGMGADANSVVAVGSYNSVPLFIRSAGL